MAGGMLVDGLDGWPADQMSLGTEGDLYTSSSPGHAAASASTCCTTSRSAAGSPGRTGRRRSSTRSGSALPARRGDLPGGPPGRAVRVLPDERHLDRRAVRARRRADRRRRGLERPDHRAGPVDRAARRTDGRRRSSAPARTGRSPPSPRTCRSGASGCGGCGSRPRCRQPSSPPSPRPGRPAARRSTRPSAPIPCSAARAWQRNWDRTTSRGGVRAGERRRASSRWAEPEGTAMTVTVNGPVVPRRRRGPGPPVLLLHGFPDSSALWRHQIPALSTPAPRDRARPARVRRATGPRASRSTRCRPWSATCRDPRRARRRAGGRRRARLGRGCSAGRWRRWCRSGCSG